MIKENMSEAEKLNIVYQHGVADGLEKAVESLNAIQSPMSLTAIKELTGLFQVAINGRREQFQIKTQQKDVKEQD